MFGQLLVAVLAVSAQPAVAAPVVVARPVIVARPATVTARPPAPVTKTVAPKVTEPTPAHVSTPVIFPGRVGTTCSDEQRKKNQC